MKEYLSFGFLLIIGALGGAWLNSQLQPVIDLEWIQQALISAVSYLFGYVILVWGYILGTAIFFRNKKGDSERGMGTNNPMPLSSQLISIAGLVGIPLSIIVGLVIGTLW